MVDKTPEKIPDANSLIAAAHLLSRICVSVVTMITAIGATWVSVASADECRIWSGPQPIQRTWVETLRDRLTFEPEVTPGIWEIDGTRLALLLPLPAEPMATSGRDLLRIDLDGCVRYCRLSTLAGPATRIGLEQFTWGEIRGGHVLAGGQVDMGEAIFEGDRLVWPSPMKPTLTRATAWPAECNPPLDAVATVMLFMHQSIGLAPDLAVRFVGGPRDMRTADLVIENDAVMHKPISDQTVAHVRFDQPLAVERPSGSYKFHFLGVSPGGPRPPFATFRIEVKRPRD